MRVVEPEHDPLDGRPWRIPLWARLTPLVLVVLVVATQTVHAVNDPDTWWHLRTGDELRGHLDLVGPDPWSPFTTREWIRHQWLGDLLLSWLHGLGGLPAVAWYVALLGTTTLVVAYLVARRDAAVLPAAALALAAAVGTSMTLSARPQSFSLPFTLVAGGAWLATARDHRSRWWLVPFTWVWACLHGFWFVAPLLGLVVAVGLRLERAPGRVVARATAVALTSLVAAALTPVGPRLLTAPFQVGTITALIDEWRPPTVGMPAFLVTWAMAMLLVLVWNVGRAPTWPEIGVLVLAGYLLVTHGRTVALAAALLVPLLARAVQERTPLGREGLGRAEVLALLVAAAVGLGGAWTLAGTRAAAPQGFPTALADRLDALPDGTVVCNDYGVGGWLWWAHPRLVPVIDGRTELYAPADVEAYARFAAGGDGTTALVSHRGCPAALVRAGSPPAATLTRGGWSVAGTAEGWTLLGRPQPPEDS